MSCDQNSSTGGVLCFPFIHSGYSPDEELDRRLMADAENKE